MLVGSDVYVRWSSCGRKPEYPEEIHLSDLVTTWPSHMPTPGIEPMSQRWEASAFTLRQPDSLIPLKTSGSRVYWGKTRMSIFKLMQCLNGISFKLWFLDLKGQFSEYQLCPWCDVYQYFRYKMNYSQSITYLNVCSWSPFRHGY